MATNTTSSGKVIRRVGEEAPTSRPTPTRRVGNDEAPSSFQPRADNVPSGPSGLTTDQRRAGMTVRDLTPVDTSQPSPANIPKATIPGAPASPVGQNLVNFDAKTGAPLAPGATTTDALGNTFTQGQKFKQAFQQTTTSGVQAPATQGAAAGAMPPPDQGQAPSPIGAIMETDKNFDSILTNFDDWFSPPKQKQSLLQEYQSMEKSLGIQAMNAEMIDAKRIIEGTEDDIRAEVTAAGGFATDSQVQAMSNARNKSLIKNYNYLQESRDSAMTQLNTMMNLSMEDRKMAEAEFDRKLDFAFKVQEFQERAKTNASNQLNKLVENVGYGGLLAATNGNAYEQGIIEKTLGLGAGGLARAAAYVKPLTTEEQLDIDLKISSLETDAMQRKNIQSQIDERNKPEPEEDILSYVVAYSNGQIPLTQVPQKIRGQVLSQVQSTGTNKMLDLLGQYKNELQGTNFLGALNPNKRAMLQGLQGQITAEYKQQKQLGTLDAGVQTLIDKIIPDPTKFSISAFSNQAQLGALNNFITNQGGGSIPAPDNSGDTVIITN